MFLAAAAALFLGVTLLILGLRGRRTDDHPLCRACRFDLVGLPPEAGRCPECGADVSTPGSRRTDHRRRLGSVIALAAVALLAGIGLGGVAGWSWAARFNWNTIKPVWWLKSESASPNRATAAGALAELADRLGKGRLGTGDASVLVARGLDLQADPDRAWIAEWGDLIDAAHRRDLLSREQVRAYARNAVEPRVALRARVRRGEPCAIEVRFDRARAGRAGQGPSVMLGLELVSAEIAGRALTAARFGARVGISAGGSSVMSNQITIDAEPGQHVLRTVWSYRALDVADGATPILDPWELTAETPITVVPADGVLILLVKDESLRRDIENAIRAPPIEVRRASGGARTFYHQLSITNLPADIAFDILWRAGGREWPMAAMALKGQAGSQTGFAYGGDAPGLEPGTGAVDIVLRPSIEAAARTTDILDVWDGEIVMKDVPIEWPKPDAPAPAGRP